MGRDIESPAARDAARQAQQIRQGQPAQGRMSIGSRPVIGPNFGQLLQEQMKSVPARSSDAGSRPEEKPREKRSEDRDSDRSKANISKHAATESEASRVQRRHDSRDQSDSRRDKDKGPDSRLQHVREAQTKVVSHQGRRESGGEKGEGQKGEHGGRQGQMSKGTTPQSSKGSDSARTILVPHGTTGKEWPAAKPKEAGLPRQIPQKVIEQVVQYARLVLRKGGEKEMEIALREEVFKGLRLKVSTKDGKVTAKFITSSKDVHGLFLNERSSMRRMLAEKGIDVEEIDVIMT